jgi:hypothetical protein
MNPRSSTRNARRPPRSDAWEPGWNDLAEFVGCQAGWLEIMRLGWSRAGQLAARRLRTGAAA